MLLHIMLKPTLDKNIIASNYLTLLSINSLLLLFRNILMNVATLKVRKRFIETTFTSLCT
jgi:hypothetical protein